MSILKWELPGDKMKTPLQHFWQHDTALHAALAPDERWRNVGYGALLVVGIPVLVAATMFAVHYLYDGMMWLLPT